MLLSLLMVLPALAACSGDDSGSGNNKNNNNGQRPDTGSHPLSFWWNGVTSLPTTNTYMSNYASAKSQLGTALNGSRDAFDKLD